MPRPKSFDDDDVLDQAIQLFSERGYEGTSLADLESRLGLGRQSLYNSFGDKQTLFLRALERYQKSYTEGGALAQLSAADTGLDAIRAFFRSRVESLTAPGPRPACLETSTILERGSQDPKALLRCNRSREGLERTLRRVLARAKARGEVSDDLDIEGTATLLVIQNYGLNVLAKTGAPAEELHAAVEVLLAGLR